MQNQRIQINVHYLWWTGRCFTGDCAACRFEKHHKAKYECNTNVWVIWVALKLEYSTYTILSIQYLRDQRLYLKIQHHPSIIEFEDELKFVLSYQFIL